MALPRSARVCVAGHNGLVGSAILRRPQAAGFTNVLTATREQLDLRDQTAVNYWFKANRPAYVCLVAGTVGGILSNSTRPAAFIYDNMMINATAVNAAYIFPVEKLVYLGSSCIYPRNCPQPMREHHLLSGPLEPTKEAYAVAKIAGLKLCRAYRKQHGCRFVSAMPSNLYEPGDTLDEKCGRVLPALMHRFHEFRVAGEEEVVVWGSGAPRRELLHVDDLARACLFLMESWNEAEHINVGTGEDLTIHEIAELARDTVHPEARICWDSSKPDGTPKKLLEVSRVHELGWKHRIALVDGIRSTCRWYLDHASTGSS